MNSSTSKSVSKGVCSVDKSNFDFCGNTNCNKKTNDLVEAPLYAQTYFGVVRKEKPPKICSECLANASKFDQLSKEIVRTFGVLFSLPTEVQSCNPAHIVNLVDDKGDGDLPTLFEAQGGTMHIAGSGVDKEVPRDDKRELQLYLIEEDKFVQSLNEMMEKFGLANQVTKCHQSLKNDIHILENEILSMEQKYKEKDAEFSKLLETYKSTFIRNKHLTVELESITIDDTANSVGNERNLTSRKNGLGVLSASYRKEVSECAASSNLFAKHLPSLFTKFKKPNEGQLVHYMNGTLLQFWVIGKIRKIELDSFNKAVYSVVFHSIPFLNPDAIIHTKINRAPKRLYGNQIAFAKGAPNINMPVGSRIIAKFEDLIGNNAATNGMYYAGVVGECKSSLNNDRYLIFFDDGYVAYVRPANIIPVVETSPDVAEDVHRELKNFIQTFLSQPKDLRVLLKVNIGDRLKVEYAGVIEDVLVKEIDCSLMKVKYIKNSKLGCEWIYRGSPRLQKIQMYWKTKSTIAPLIPDIGITNTSNVSAASSIKVFPKSGFSGLRDDDLAIFTEYEVGGTNEKIAIPKNCPTPKGYSVHTCSFICGYKYDEKAFREVSPLVVPFYLGWAREIKLDKKTGTVSYVTPCGICLSTYNSIHKYIQITGISIPIEFFTLEISIDCLNYFKPLRKLRGNKDISSGVEGAPIECINSLDYDLPEPIVYSSCRIPVGILINQDPGFMVCCDCEDDCQDSTNCICKNLTLSGLSFREDDTLNSYTFRRLGNHVPSGIYECNQRCKCNVKTCLNRVVQNKVQWPLQIFKTVKKGWGVRALHDIPKGSFLGIYAGKLLNDFAQTKEGEINGDKYIADLDFIEGMEARKEGYEASCPDVEEELQKCPNSSQTECIRKSQHKFKEKPQVARKSTAGMSRKVILDNATKSNNCSAVTSTDKKISYREYFDEENPYTIDGNKVGNFGRYLNHSCDPNVFIQTVFVDTHDLRFPWIAFFTNNDIKAGTELCWDYKYVVNSVPGRKLICHCNSKKCRKRLL